MLRFWKTLLKIKYCANNGKFSTGNVEAGAVDDVKLQSKSWSYVLVKERFKAEAETL